MKCGRKLITSKYLIVTSKIDQWPLLFDEKSLCVFLSNNKHNICYKYAVDSICAISFLTNFFFRTWNYEQQCINVFGIKPKHRANFPHTIISPSSFVLLLQGYFKMNALIIAVAVLSTAVTLSIAEVSDIVFSPYYLYNRFKNKRTSSSCRMRTEVWSIAF